MQIALIAIWHTTALGLSTGIFAAFAALAIFSGAEAVVVSYLAHYRSLGPSLLLNSWILLGIATDAVLVRSVWIRSARLALSAVSIALTATRAIILLLEEWPKPVSLADTNDVAKESKAGILN